MNDYDDYDDVISTTMSEPRTIVLDITERMIYWTDWEVRTIERATYEGTERKILLTESHLYFPNGLAIEFKDLPQTDFLLVADMHGFSVINLVNGDLGDHVFHNLSVDVSNMIAIDFDVVKKRVYFSDVTTKRILSSTIDGEDVRVEIINNETDVISTNMSEPRTIVLDTTERMIYWTDWGVRTIERATYEGTEREILFTEKHLYFPNGLAIDFQVGRIYWVDAAYDYIGSANFDGTNVTAVASLGSIHTFGIALYKEMTVIPIWKNLSVGSTQTGFERPCDIHVYLWEGSENVHFCPLQRMDQSVIQIQINMAQRHILTAKTTITYLEIVYRFAKQTVLGMALCQNARKRWTLALRVIKTMSVFLLAPNAQAVFVHVQNSLTVQATDATQKKYVVGLDILDNQEWTDDRLVWNPIAYSNVTLLHVPSDVIWTPDIVVVNSADEYPMASQPTGNVIIHSDGSIVYYQSKLIYAYGCTTAANVECNVKFSSWTYNGFELNLINTMDEVATNYEFEGPFTSRKFLSGNVTRNVHRYACCPEPNVSLTYKLKLKLKTP
ncbi:LRP4-like protein [Mya arenaria]|uniref:LRP4-like protein n=1 Tax=Mya arenaria TaxID=6604 RepID=A0ABY7FMM6_MYAAR|nr:LRP4-like protein [Mya arenaria]